MARFSRAWWLALFASATLLITACSSPSEPQPSPPSPTAATGGWPSPSNGLVQSQASGGVTISVKWAQVDGNFLVLEVVLDTHSVNLDQYNLAALAVLRDEKGAEYQPLSWQPSGGGHHLSGPLTFPAPPSLSRGEARYLELLLRGVAGVEERALRWELG